MRRIKFPKKERREDSELDIVKSARSLAANRSQSGRGLPQSKTLRDVQRLQTFAQASWTAPVLWRFSQGVTKNGKSVFPTARSLAGCDSSFKENETPHVVSYKRRFR